MDWVDTASTIDTGGSFTEGGAETGPLGLVVGSLIGRVIVIGIAIAIAVVLWLSVNILISAVVIVSMPLFFLFRRSLRYVVAEGRSCHKNLRPSFVFALRATVAITLWFYLILVGAHNITRLTF